MRFKEFSELPIVREVIVTADGCAGEMLREGKWISGRFERNIRIDPPAHGVGQVHAHILGRRRDELGVVNIDGTGSHGTKCRISDEDADALRARGFRIPPGNVIEWRRLRDDLQLLFG